MQLAATQSRPETVEGFLVSDAYATLKLKPGASRRDIKRAYHRLALATHPDRLEKATDGSIFRKIKDAYELLCEYTQFEAELEAVDAELQEQERMLDELERKRQKRELETGQQQQIVDNIRRFNQEQRARDEMQKFAREREAQARLRVQFDMHALKVREEEKQKELPKGIMLEWWGHNGWATHVPLQKHDINDCHGNPVVAWASQDKRIWIERRPMPNNALFWLLTLTEYEKQYGLYSDIPYNTAARNSKMFKWAHWHEVRQRQDRPGIYRVDRPASLVTRAIDEEELNQLAGIAQRQAVWAKEQTQFASFMQQLAADEEKERQERKAREAQRNALQEQREQAKKRREAAQERAQQEAQEQTARQLEYQDAAWKAFLDEVCPAKPALMGPILLDLSLHPLSLPLSAICVWCAARGGARTEKGSHEDGPYRALGGACRGHEAEAGGAQIDEREPRRKGCSSLEEGSTEES